MPNALAPTNNALNEPSAAFGFFPQLKRNRTQQDPEAAKDMPVQFGMARGAATLGLPADIANIFRSPSQTEMFGETNYDAPAQFNWTTQHFACGEHYPSFREVQRVTVSTPRCASLGLN